MIRVGTQHPGRPVGRRQVFRVAFAGLAGLAGLEVAGALLPFLKVNRVVGLGVPVTVGPLAAILERFGATNDAPILFREGHFFLLHAPGAVVAAYRKCTHLGCAVPYVAAEDQFHCPCHQSRYDKHTAVVTGGPAPKPLQLFHISTRAGQLVVDTNPLNVIDRPENRWDPVVIEIADTGA
ncbi:MAG TPA: Rieske 2Fe-2S domain-containing protein [Candidatus Saccharimonadales bacterium]|nr:Rieske 2Fe-2S domain-containing protein [Candidatus Saccharimonadales bacterium]